MGYLINKINTIENTVHQNILYPSFYHLFIIEIYVINISGRFTACYVHTSLQRTVLTGISQLTT